LFHNAGPAVDDMQTTTFDTFYTKPEMHLKSEIRVTILIGNRDFAQP